MMYLHMPRAKKISMAFIAAMAMIPGIVLLTGCPPTENKNKSTAKTNLLNNIDSASLINHLAYLSSGTMQGRETATPGNKLARDYIGKIFDSLKIEKIGDSYLQPFSIGNDSLQGVNVIGVIKGYQYANSYITITAHYDHLGIRNGETYYGTDDNASGTAALLAMAAYFKQHQPKHSLLLVSFDAEEKGLLGSKYFVSHSPVPLSAISVNVNMDMISRSDSSEIYATGIYHYPYLKKYVDSVLAFTPVHIQFGHDGEKPGIHDWTNQSDHFPFHQNKIPYLYFGVEDHADYHRPGDTFDKVNKSFYYQVCCMITAVASLLDKPEFVQ